jgi:hypothetical protein
MYYTHTHTPPPLHTQITRTLPDPRSLLSPYRDRTLVTSDVSTAENEESAWWGALTKGLEMCTSPPHSSPPTTITLLYHARLFHARLLSPAIKSHCLPYILNFRSTLSSFLNADFSRVVETRLFKKDWVQVPGRAHNTRILNAIQPTLVIDPPITTKLLPFILWQRDLLEHPPQPHHANIAYSPLPTPTPPPFVKGLLSHKTRQAFCNGLQLLTSSGKWSSARVARGARDV